jgi:hypothetical protein
LWRLRTRMNARQSSVSGIFEVNIGDPY